MYVVATENHQARLCREASKRPTSLVERPAESLSPAGYGGETIKITAIMKTAYVIAFFQGSESLKIRSRNWLVALKRAVFFQVELTYVVKGTSDRYL
jgi:hypothetical protein